MIDPSVKEQFVELRAQGMSFASISGKLNVSKATLIGWSKDAKEDIGNMRQIHLEGLREKYRIGAERRMELFAKQLDAVEGEIAKRDLATVPTERLFDILSKLGRDFTVDVPVTFHRKSASMELDPDVLCSVTEWQA